jgi:hypothetical protein
LASPPLVETKKMWPPSNQQPSRRLNLAPPAAKPWLKVIRRLYLTGIEAHELDQLHALTHSPLGVDLWLASASGALAVIPRSALWIREA